MSDTPLITIPGPAEAELIEKKSCFIGRARPVEDEAQALAFLEQARAKDPGANHHCYAWNIGRDNQFQRSSDAGEPSGTAGRPILEAIKRAGLQNTAVVVTRYFGGVLLGAGGLTRAYGRAAQLALEAAGRVLRLPAVKFALTFDYSLLGKVEAFLQQNGFPLADKIYGAEVCFICLIESERLDFAARALADLSGGALRMQDLGESAYVDKPL